MLDKIETILTSVILRDRAGEGVTIRDITGDVQLSAPTVTKYLQQLKARGYVDYTIQHHRPNCKKRVWVITQKGRDFLSELWASSMFVDVERTENEQL